MAELDDDDAGCDDPAVHFYGAAQNADVATAEIARGYGMLHRIRAPESEVVTLCQEV